MPRGKLNETYVQKIAVKWLANYYQEEFKTKFIVAGMEARIKKNSPLGNGRADGLIVAKLDDGSFYTVSLEAKSSRTWHNVNIRQRHRNMVFHAFLFAIITVILIALLGLRSIEGGFQNAIFPVIIIAVIGFCFIKFTPLRNRYLEIDVVNQVQRYPANEKWIALSTDMYNRLISDNRETHFRELCSRKGIGLIRISPNKNIKDILRPTKIPTPKNLDSFLACYARSVIVQNQMTRMLQEAIEPSEPLLLDEPERGTEGLNAAEIEDLTENYKSDASP